ncbi:uncharacterized protein KY384_006747 [Bacidia gigantensis]|uniref:uncharacterized protein n=1 Tax=Bacidia gigantensis TaxID=2732470 RepID=UPI001D047D6E|nr:uncharacterized protein KY384_006747 [Bacidia gigantensis]KAG8527831.1 hypothetical protein KY384_006747 [Bacidia gigantensis]
MALENFLKRETNSSSERAEWVKAWPFTDQQPYTNSPYLSFVKVTASFSTSFRETAAPRHQGMMHRFWLQQQQEQQQQQYRQGAALRHQLQQHQQRQRQQQLQPQPQQQ